ncbi:MAG: hypothetical protein AAB897_03660 [Patescibacteria group bacterium]
MKRLSYLIIILAVVALVVLIGYFLRYRAGEPATSGEPSPGGLPAIPTEPISQPGGEEGGGAVTPPAEVVQPGEQKFGVIAQNQVFDFFVDAQNNTVLIQPDGQVVKVVKGEASVLSSSVINNLRRAEFSYDGKFILASFGGASGQEHSIFNIDAKSWSPLSGGISSPTWSPMNYQITYFRENAGVKTLETLNTADPKAKPQELTRLNAEDLLLSWISPNQMIIGERGSALVAGSLWSFDTQKKTMSLFMDGVLGLNSAWSGEASTGLVFRTDVSRRGGTLSLYDVAGNALANLSFLSLPSKCAFDAVPANGTGTAASKFLYCAIPANAESFGNSMLPDDYEKRALFARDGFFRVDLAEGGIKELLTGQLVDGNRLKIFGKNLFFINRLDGRLYALALE